MDEKKLYQGPVFSLIQKEMEMNDHVVSRDIIVHHGGVALCAVQDGKILLVSQTRAAVNEKTLEIPAGTREPGEAPEVTGLRELNEETGYTCQKMELITAFWPTPGYDTEVIWVYDCQGITPVKERLSMDQDEDVEKLWMDLDEAAKAIAEGKIRDGKTIISIYYALLHRQD